VWMGRDDARPIPGLQGGTAPARAFHDYMVVATATRPVEQFETQVPLPNWQLEPDEEAMGVPIDSNAIAAETPMVDADGNPLPPQAGTQPVAPSSAGQPQIRPDGTGAPDQAWLDEVLNRGRDRRPASPPPQRQPQPSTVPPDSARDGSEPPQQ
ncbi:MAG: penicillin-binding protein, partial [Sphingomonadales bacterium]|nr:penicillin-binding protein [Sphingomonadales bacterium]